MNKRREIEREEKNYLLDAPNVVYRLLLLENCLCTHRETRIMSGNVEKFFAAVFWEVLREMQKMKLPNGKNFKNLLKF